MANNRYVEYLDAVKKPFLKLAKLEFLQPDNSVAFVLDNNPKRFRATPRDSRAFIQSGSLSVSMQNGQRRKATITLSNVDGEFDYAVNKVWFGQRLRLQMGLVLPDGTEFYLPQGVFYIKEPKNEIKPNSRQITYNLVDKWTYLDGSLMGRLPYSYQIPQFVDNDETKGATNIFNAMTASIQMDKFTLKERSGDSQKMLDNVTPIYTNYYNDKPNVTYKKADGTEVSVSVLSLPFSITKAAGETVADVLLELNRAIVGWIGYDPTGALRVEAAEEDIRDGDKPIQWVFTPENSQLLELSETIKNGDVYNDIIVVGEGVDDYQVYARAQNFDSSSETNIDLIGLRTYKEERADFWNKTQCVAYAKYLIKKKTILQKSITITSSQLFHLQENGIVQVVRSDKEGSPVEMHLINSFTIPLAETGQMTINCTSINDFDNFTITTPDYGTIEGE